MKYYLQARLFPTLLTSVPLLTWVYNILMPYSDSLSSIHSFLPLAAASVFYAAILFLLVQINRLVAVEVFQRFIYKGENYMPTTTQLLWSDKTYDPISKKQIRDKIESRFSTELLTADDEGRNEELARKRISLAVSQIRNSLRDNKVLLQHNIEYGFFRNMVGGSLVALLLAISLTIYASRTANATLSGLAVLMICFYATVMLLGIPIIMRYGRYYTKILLEQFLSI